MAGKKALQFFKIPAPSLLKIKIAPGPWTKKRIFALYLSIIFFLLWLDLLTLYYLSPCIYGEHRGLFSEGSKIDWNIPRIAFSLSFVFYSAFTALPGWILMRYALFLEKPVQKISDEQVPSLKEDLKKLWKRIKNENEKKK